MEIDSEMRRKIGVSVVAVSVFILIILWIGATYGGTALSATGGLALVGSIVLFIVVMAGVGVWLSG
jgi:anaerobic C4-dicarboxylate transporter